jgi:hypothetical protein
LTAIFDPRGVVAIPCHQDVAPIRTRQHNASAIAWIAGLRAETVAAGRGIHRLAAPVEMRPVVPRAGIEPAFRRKSRRARETRHHPHTRCHP